jgi:hypothetical protein
VIDVLAFPPSTDALDAMRRRRLAGTEETKRRGRLALFVSVTLFIAWVADVAAVFEQPAGIFSAAFGIGSVVLACMIVASHTIGRALMRRALRARLAAEHGFAAVRLHQAGEVLAVAGRDAGVAQYLRMVGRQGRALRVIEMDALIQRGKAGSPFGASEPRPPTTCPKNRTEALRGPSKDDNANLSADTTRATRRELAQQDCAPRRLAALKPWRGSYRSACMSVSDLIHGEVARN